MSETHVGRVTAHFGYEGEKLSKRTVSGKTKPVRRSLPTALSWGIVMALLVVIIGMAATPFVPQDLRVVPAFSAAAAFFVLYALVKRASTIRGW